MICFLQVSESADRCNLVLWNQKNNQMKYSEASIKGTPSGQEEVSRRLIRYKDYMSVHFAGTKVCKVWMYTRMKKIPHVWFRINRENVSIEFQTVVFAQTKNTASPNCVLNLRFDAIKVLFIFFFEIPRMSIFHKVTDSYYNFRVTFDFRYGSQNTISNPRNLVNQQPEWRLIIISWQISLRTCINPATTLQSTLSKADTLGTSSSCPPYRGVRLMKS